MKAVTAAHRHAAPRRASDMPVSAQARGQLRILRTALDSRAVALTEASERVPRDLLRSVKHKTTTGRDKAMAAILRMMPEAPLRTEKRAALWRTFVPQGEMIIVRAVGFGVLGTGGWTNEPFGLAYSAHALGRLLDRTNFMADPLTAMIEGHDALLSLQPEEGYAAYALASLTLPACLGAFLVTPDPQRDHPFATAATWLSPEQLWQDQENDLKAWNTLASSGAIRSH